MFWFCSKSALFQISLIHCISLIHKYTEEVLMKVGFPALQAGYGNLE